MVGQILKNLCKGNTTAVVFFCMERATWATLSPQRVERAHSMQLQRLPPRWGAGNLRRSCCRCRRFVPRRIVVESGGVLKVRIIGGSKVRTLTIVRPPSPLPFCPEQDLENTLDNLNTMIVVRKSEGMLKVRIIGGNKLSEVTRLEL